MLCSDIELIEYFFTDVFKLCWLQAINLGTSSNNI